MLFHVGNNIISPQHIDLLFHRPPPPEETDGEKHKINPLAERLLAQLEISLASEDHLTEAEQQQQDMLDIRCLQVLRALIHNRIKSVDPEMKDSDAAEYRKYESSTSCKWTSLDILICSGGVLRSFTPFKKRYKDSEMQQKGFVHNTTFKLCARTILGRPG